MRKIMRHKKPILLSLLAGLSLCILGGCASTASAEVDIRDYFNIPAEKQTTAYVGAETDLAKVKATDINATNFNFTLLDENGDVVETDGYKFVPKKAGAYKCVYSYMLAGERYEYSYVINVTVKDGPVFADDLSLPHALIAERPYVLPEISAKDYNLNQDVNVEITVKCSGEEVTVVNNTFTPVYDGIGSEAEIIYTATSGGVTERIVEKLPIMNPFAEETTTGVVDFTQIFYTNGFESSAYTADSMIYTTINDAEAKFVNIMHEDGVDFSFGFGENYEAEAITMKIESLEDPSVFVTLTYAKGKIEEGKGKNYLNGKESKDYTYSAKEQLRVKYDAGKKQLIGSGGTLLFTIKEDANGNTFEGFPTSDLRVSFTVENVYGTVDLAFYKVANLTLNDQLVGDAIEPVLYFAKMPLEYFVGDTITISGVKSYDVVNPNVDVKVTIRLSGQIVTDVDGRAINNVDGKKSISFKATKNGMYLVSYTIVDGSGNPNVLAITRSLYVYDREAPIVEVAGSIPTTAKVGQTITIPDINATDAQSGTKVTLQLIVRWPSAKMLQLVESKNGTITGATFQFDKEGTYTIMVVATDDSYNYTRKEFKVVVVGG